MQRKPRLSCVVVALQGSLCKAQYSVLLADATAESATDVTQLLKKLNVTAIMKVKMKTLRPTLRLRPAKEEFDVVVVEVNQASDTTVCAATIGSAPAASVTMCAVLHRELTHWNYMCKIKAMALSVLMITYVSTRMT